MSKIYFVVGAGGTGTIALCNQIISAYGQTNKTINLRRLGMMSKLENAGNVSPDQTLAKIIELLDKDSGDHGIVFAGWRIPYHIQEIYNTYKDQACFIFTHDESKTPEALENFTEFVTAEVRDRIIAEQTTQISNFLAGNNISLNWITVQEPFFDSALQANTTSGSGVSIAILGSMN